MDTTTMTEIVKKAMDWDVDAMVEVMRMCAIVRDDVITEVIKSIKQ